ncbi:hypothetical protein F5Y15DRAFT_283886 [Xylariaceae sp. FL0016]|nr:hypothetical protein F5Y15DRAFT_283886 [Xylariaceae sp. FL0016]
MADEDFEIDVYGDASAENESKPEDVNNQAYEANSSITIANGSNPPDPDRNDPESHANHSEYDNQSQQGSTGPDQNAPAQSYQQGVKRKGDSDDRPIDPGATNCLLISELNWWITDDDIREWVRQADCESELKDITFSEHKVNGKSKGQSYIELSSQQAATAAKHQIESSHEPSQPGTKKHTVIYASPTNNPFRTLPKDAPARANKESGSRGGATGGGFNDRGGFRGRGGFNGPRGGFNNRNFSGGNMGGGFHNNMGGGGGGGFNNNMGGGNFGFNNMGGGGGGGNFGFRGGMNMGGGMRGGGMRGGRGGMNPGMNMMGFQQTPHFNPAFFGGNQQSDWQNPHGAKRPRGE